MFDALPSFRGEEGGGVEDGDVDWVSVGKCLDLFPKIAQK